MCLLFYRRKLKGFFGQPNIKEFLKINAPNNNYSNRTQAYFRNTEGVIPDQYLIK